MCASTLLNFLAHSTIGPSCVGQLGTIPAVLLLLSTSLGGCGGCITLLWWGTTVCGCGGGVTLLRLLFCGGGESSKALPWIRLQSGSSVCGGGGGGGPCPACASKALLLLKCATQLQVILTHTLNNELSNQTQAASKLHAKHPPRGGLVHPRRWTHPPLESQKLST